MSDAIPYASPQLQTDELPPPKKPGRLVAICIISLVLGILGVFSVCGTGVSFAISSFAIPWLEGIKDRTPELEFQLQNIEMQQPLMIPAMVLSSVNLFVAVGLIVGAIGGLQLKKSLHGIFCIALIAAAAYSVLKFGLQIYAMSLQWNGLNALAAKPELQEMASEIEKLASTSRNVVIFAGIFNLAMVIAIFGFYLYAARYLKKPEIASLFR